MAAWFVRSRQYKVIEIPQSAAEYKREIEKETGCEITIRDRIEHPEYQTKAPAFADGNTVYIDTNTSLKEKEEDLFHEITHVYFRHIGFPAITERIQLSTVEKVVLNKLLSLVEDLFVNDYLRGRAFPCSSFNYDKVLEEIKDIDKEGKFVGFGNQNLPDGHKILLAECFFIRLLIDSKCGDRDSVAIKVICVKNLGAEIADMIIYIAKELKTLYTKEGSPQDKAYQMFLFILDKFGLLDKVLVTK